MITIREKAVITKKQHVISIDVGRIVPEGEYEVEMILESKNRSTKRDFKFSGFRH